MAAEQREAWVKRISKLAMDRFGGPDMDEESIQVIGLEMVGQLPKAAEKPRAADEPPKAGDKGDKSRVETNAEKLPELSPVQLAVAKAAAEVLDTEEGRVLSISAISQKTGLDTRSVRSSVACLKNKGVIRNVAFARYTLGITEVMCEGRRINLRVGATSVKKDAPKPPAMKLAEEVDPLITQLEDLHKKKLGGALAHMRESELLMREAELLEKALKALREK